jgi:putative aldouronate transport system permease protein
MDLKPVSWHVDEGGFLKRQIGRSGGFLKELSRSKILILMCVPAILFFIVFCYAPMPGAYIAFTDFKYNQGIFGSRFVGLENFRFLIISGKLWLLTRNTILYNLVFIFLGNAVQIFVAVLLNEVRTRWFKKVAQSVMFLPYFISAVLVGFLAFSILNYDYGFIPNIFKSLGLGAPKFYSNPAVWPFLIVMVNLWQTTGYGSIVYFAAIMGIDPAIYEAAEIDGAHAIQKIRYIILPSLKPTAVVLILYSIGGILKGNFGLFYNLVGNGNPILQPTTDIIETFVYRSLMNQFNFSSSAAAGLYQSVVGFAIVLTANWLVKKAEPDYALF